MKTLSVKVVDFDYEANGQTYTDKTAEFFIDDNALSDLLNEGRHLGNCGCSFHPRATQEVKQHFADMLTGRKKAESQLDTDRLVLYRCHCGCDYCGVISVDLVMNTDTIEWKAIAWQYDVYEDDDEDEFEYFEIDKLVSHKKQYIDTIDSFVASSQ